RQHISLDSVCVEDRTFSSVLCSTQHIANKHQNRTAHQTANSACSAQTSSCPSAPQRTSLTGGGLLCFVGERHPCRSLPKSEVRRNSLTAPTGQTGHAGTPYLPVHVSPQNPSFKVGPHSLSECDPLAVYARPVAGCSV